MAQVGPSLIACVLFMNRLHVDVVAAAGGVGTDPTSITSITPLVGTLVDFDSNATATGDFPLLLRNGKLVYRFSVDTKHVPTQVVFTAERPSTRPVRARPGFDTVGIMDPHVGLQIELSSET